MDNEISAKFYHTNILTPPLPW